MANPDVYEILNRLQTPDAQVIRQAIENLKTERDFERRERLRLDELRAELAFAVARLQDEARDLRFETQHERSIRYGIQDEVDRLKEIVAMQARGDQRGVRAADAAHPAGGAAVRRNWPDATDIESETVDKYEFTSRFRKPDWFEE